ncbi:MAG TPA: hypothetical protein VEV81_02150, partial [Pyrinomonadaceae bacterium]|nr:hypothetical protein [Pyrinomonadaceae bacterium]
SFSDNNIESISVAQYHPVSINALKEKLGQFPERTTFKWNPSSNDEKAAEQLFADLQSYLKEHGMKLEKASSEK